MKSTTSKLVGSGRRAFLAQAAALTASTCSPGQVQPA